MPCASSSCSTAGIDVESALAPGAGPQPGRSASTIRQGMEDNLDGSLKPQYNEHQQISGPLATLWQRVQLGG